MLEVGEERREVRELDVAPELHHGALRRAGWVPANVRACHELLGRADSVCRFVVSSTAGERENDYGRKSGTAAHLYQATRRHLARPLHDERVVGKLPTGTVVAKDKRLWKARRIRPAFADGMACFDTSKDRRPVTFGSRSHDRRFGWNQRTGRADDIRSGCVASETLPAKWAGKPREVAGDVLVLKVAPPS